MNLNTFSVFGYIVGEPSIAKDFSGRIYCNTEIKVSKDNKHNIFLTFVGDNCKRFYETAMMGDYITAIGCIARISFVVNKKEVRKQVCLVKDFNIIPTFNKRRKE